MEDSQKESGKIIELHATALRKSSLTLHNKPVRTLVLQQNKHLDKRGRKKKRKKKRLVRRKIQNIFVKNSITIQLQKCILSSLYKNKTK